MPEAILVSACLLGLDTRYSGQTKRNQQVIDYLREQQLIPIPVCPEQLAGLPTPRPATQFSAGDGHAVLEGSGQVCNQHGEDLSEVFRHGAEQTLLLARLSGCRRAILKERSPSCGIKQIYRQGELCSGMGVAAAKLQQAEIELFSEEQLPEHDQPTGEQA